MLTLLQDRIPASFTEVAPQATKLMVVDLPNVFIHERRRLDVEGAGLSASEYLLTSPIPVNLDERAFLNSALGPDISQ